jgi:uncharacterized membrane protein
MENIFLKGIILILAIIVLDTLWFSSMKTVYHAEAGNAFKAPNYYYACATYLLLIIGLLYFTTSENATTALQTGALLGFIVYGVYNFTNLTIIAHWTPKLALIDTLWGTIACAIVSYVHFLLR